jgi:hypothetical protein
VVTVPSLFGIDAADDGFKEAKLMVTKRTDKV